MSVVTATLLSGSAKIEKYHLISIDIRREANRIPCASLVLLDGDSAKREFPLSDAGYFEPGKEIEVKLRYESAPRSDPGAKDTTLFKGPVIRHGIEANARGALLRIELGDAAIKLTQSRKSAVFDVDKTDKEAIGEVLKECGVDEGKLAPTEGKHKQLVRYHATGWDFILLRAEANGQWVVAEDGKVSTVDPRTHQPPKTHEISYGVRDVVYELELEADARHQIDGVEAVSWNLEKAELSEKATAEEPPRPPGDLDGKALAAAVGAANRVLSYPVPVPKEELKAWANASLARSRLSMIRGRLALRGRPDVKLADAVTIDGVGKRFSGTALVTGVCHRVDADGWRTDIQLGLSARSFAREEGIADAPAAGLLPAVGGLQIGVVGEFKEDKDQKLRVQVRLPGADAGSGAVWARLAAPYAGAGRGWFFRPEPGDEVVLGFFADDPRQPVILGALHGPKNASPEGFTVAAENKSKGLVTRYGSVVGFTDEDKKSQVFVKTAGGAQLVLDDAAKSLELADQNGNTLKMDKDGITITTKKAFKVEAKGEVGIAGQKVNIK